MFDTCFSGTDANNGYNDIIDKAIIDLSLSPSLDVDNEETNEADHSFNLLKSPYTVHKTFERGHHFGTRKQGAQATPLHTKWTKEQTLMNEQEISMCICVCIA